MTQCHICGKEMGDEEKFISVQLHDPKRKNGIEWRMNMHQGECYDKFIVGAYKLTDESKIYLERRFAEAMMGLDDEEKFLFFTSVAYDLKPGTRRDIFHKIRMAISAAEGVSPTIEEYREVKK